jgi:hypothetical protein
VSLTLADWRRLYKVLDPKRRLELDDMGLFVERHDSVAPAIARSLTSGFDEQGKWLICGSVGSGKSSELVRLAALLRDTHVVVGVDLWQSAGRVEELSPSEILYCIGAAAVRTASELWAHEIPKPLVEQLQATFSGLLDRRHRVDLRDFVEGVALFAVDLLAPGIGPAGTALGRVAKASAGKRELPIGRTRVGGLTRSTKEGDPALAELQDAVDAILTEVASIRAPVVLLDGLDKLTDLAQIRDLFATSKVLASPHAPLVYTGPVTLMVGAEWSAAGTYFERARLTNLPVNRRAARAVTDTKVEAAREVARSALRQRCEHEAIDFSAFAVDGVELLIDKSGGVLRQLMHLAREACKIAGFAGAPQLESEHVQSACDQLRKEFEITMNGERREALEYITAHGEPRGDQVSHELLLWNYAFPYVNGEVWFEPNPLIELERRREYGSRA